MNPLNVTGCSEDERFVIELEFILSLANPHYINFLAQNRYFEDESFNSYLSYLLYWKRPEYARFITYPSALFFLDMLQSKEFKEAVAKCSVAEFLHTQQFLAWQK